MRALILGALLAVACAPPAATPSHSATPDPAPTAAAAAAPPAPSATPASFPPAASGVPKGGSYAATLAFGGRTYAAVAESVYWVTDDDVAEPLGPFTPLHLDEPQLVRPLLAYRVRGVDPARWVAYRTAPGAANNVVPGGSGQEETWSFPTSGWALALAADAPRAFDRAVCRLMRTEFRGRGEGCPAGPAPGAPAGRPAHAEPDVAPLRRGRRPRRAHGVRLVHAPLVQPGRPPAAPTGATSLCAPDGLPPELLRWRVRETRGSRTSRAATEPQLFVGLPHW